MTQQITDQNPNNQIWSTSSVSGPLLVLTIFWLIFDAGAVDTPPHTSLTRLKAHSRKTAAGTDANCKLRSIIFSRELLERTRQYLLC